MLNDHLFGGLDVGAVVGEAAGDLYGADYGVGVGLGLSGFFDDAVEGEADFGAAAEPEAGGVGMAIEGGEAGDIVVFDDLIVTGPVEEGFVDGFAFGVVADGAFAGVAVFGGWGCCGL